MVRIFVSSRRPCDSEAFATSSYGTNFAQPLSAGTLVRAARKVVLPWAMGAMVPPVPCGLLRSKFSLAMSSSFYLFSVHLRASRHGGQPSPCRLARHPKLLVLASPTSANATVGAPFALTARKGW